MLSAASRLAGRRRSVQPRLPPAAAAAVNLHVIRNCRFESVPSAEKRLSSRQPYDVGLVDVVVAFSASNAKHYQTTRVFLSYSHNSHKSYNSSDGRPSLVASANEQLTPLLETRPEASGDNKSLAGSKRVERQPLFVVKKIADRINMPLIVLIKPACSLDTRRVFWYCYYYAPAVPAQLAPSSLSGDFQV